MLTTALNSTKLIRALRLVLALGAGFTLIHHLKIHMSNWVMVTTTIVLFDQQTVGGTLNRGRLRFWATFYGAALSILCILLFPHQPLVIWSFIAVTTFGYGYLYMGSKDSYIGVMGVVTVSILLVNVGFSTPLVAALYRLSDIVIGITSSNPYIETIWEKLVDEDKINFFNKFYTLYMSNRNPMPNISAKRLLTQLETNKLEVFSNKIRSITFNDKEFILKLANGNCQVFHWIINATGQSKNIKMNPLYSKLLKHGLIRENIIGGLDVAKTDQLCFGSNGKTTSGLYGIGPKTLGTYINVNSAEMLSIKAECIAKQLTQRIRG